ncbi:MAG: hypothetical protein DWQ31_05270 [Planctomycetota bacterium]|nr:MAG: hypothetical protein DWQ31_05270 [Planctomycetota bacterium]REJ97600.1 MAG: hypothetical protein DWQ35_01680 [Planctomycetota bacterium]REK23022.1 MAG: hypothetical protein DWQ42_15980 [Planctomycetota bacterium]REK43385.1 MAG: hypothetical protein DWQ46_11680 [Planctomycetota bacterium]
MPAATRRSTRLAIAAAGLALLLVLAFGSAAPVAADEEPPGDGQPSLQTLLEAGLKARRPVEFRFIDRVCELVIEGELPRSLVQQTFIWARRRNARPFPYFERAMRVQAERLGVKI